jgi:hypothetical protein
MYNERAVTHGVRNAGVPLSLLIPCQRRHYSVPRRTPRVTFISLCALLITCLPRSFFFLQTLSTPSEGRHFQQLLHLSLHTPPTFSHNKNSTTNHQYVRLHPLPERVRVRQRDRLLRHLGCPRPAHPARQGRSLQLPPCHQERRPHPMAPYSWHEDLDVLAASPPKVSAVAVSPSSQDDRGFTRGEESFTIITSSLLILRNVATSADVLRHDRSLHASSHFL